MLTYKPPESQFCRQTYRPANEAADSGEMAAPAWSVESHEHDNMAAVALIFIIITIIIIIIITFIIIATLNFFHPQYLLPIGT
jgi:heme/copper-type cytochrome/quinol oxidase subunit 2